MLRPDRREVAHVTGSQVKQEQAASSSLTAQVVFFLAVNAYFRRQAGNDCIIQSFRGFGALPTRLVFDNPECNSVLLVLLMLSRGVA